MQHSRKVEIIRATISPTPLLRRFGASLGLIAAVIAFAAPLAAPSAAMADAPSGLTIEVSDAVDEASAGDELTVDATLVNDGSENVDATLVLSAPAYSAFDSSEGAEVSGTDASWSVSVGAGESTTVTATITVGEIPETEYQLSTLASVYLGEASGAPVIRAADVNVIPGRSNPVEPAASSEAAAEAPIDLRLILAAVAGVAAITAAVAVAIVVRRRRRATYPS